MGVIYHDGSPPKCSSGTAHCSLEHCLVKFNVKKIYQKKVIAIDTDMISISITSFGQGIIKFIYSEGHGCSTAAGTMAELSGGSKRLRERWSSLQLVM